VPNPLVTIIVTTYNRADRLRRAIDSALGQSMPDLEVVVVDDGSTDETPKVLASYPDPRVRVVKHPRNLGTLAAKRTGLDHIQGEWFTYLDSDDELLPEALETLLAVPETMDPNIDFVICNSLDAATGRWSGTGLDHDAHVDVPLMLRCMDGASRGLIKTERLGTLRFRPVEMSHHLLWVKVLSRSRAHYIHKVLYVYHTQGDDRVTKHPEIGYRRPPAASYRLLMRWERGYFRLLARYKPSQYARLFYHSLQAHGQQGRSTLTTTRGLRRIAAMAHVTLGLAECFVWAGADAVWLALRRPDPDHA